MIAMAMKRSAEPNAKHAAQPARSAQRSAGAVVSTPVAWSELGKLDLRGAHFNLRKALARYRRSGDPWLQQPCRAQSLSAAVQRELERRTA